MKADKINRLQCFAVLCTALQCFQVSVVLNKIDILRDMAVDVEEFTLKMRDSLLSFLSKAESFVPYSVLCAPLLPILLRFSAWCITTYWAEISHSILQHTA